MAILSKEHDIPSEVNNSNSSLSPPTSIVISAISHLRHRIEKQSQEPTMSARASRASSPTEHVIRRQSMVDTLARVESARTSLSHNDAANMEHHSALNSTWMAIQRWVRVIFVGPFATPRPRDGTTYNQILTWHIVRLLVIVMVLFKIFNMITKKDDCPKKQALSDVAAIKPLLKSLLLKMA